jgi:aldose sugar dehydrogenase
MSNGNFFGTAEACKWPPGPTKPWHNRAGALLVGITTLACSGVGAQAADLPKPKVFDPNLDVMTVVAGLTVPTGMAFLPNDEADLDFLVLERRSGRVRHVVRDKLGKISDLGTGMLDLNVNSAGTRGLLSIALHPDFADNKLVYLFWTESNAPDMDFSGPGSQPKVQLLGNRVDRFVWNDVSSTLTLERNIIMLRAFQDAVDVGGRNGAPAAHNGGVIRFGPDGKLYIAVGDVGRRGWMQNLECGTAMSCSPQFPGTDDKLGSAQPDEAHLTGVILRLNDDGSAPAGLPPEGNPFFSAKNVSVGGVNGHRYPIAAGSEVGKNIQKIFAYGIRNLYGMDFDPASGNLWLEENGEDSFSQLHRIEPGQNGGWIQIRGPLSRIAQYREIETSAGFDYRDQFGALSPCALESEFEQGRFSPSRIAGTAEDALSRLVMIEGAHYKDPEFSWKFEVAPAAIGFMQGRGLGPQYENDLFVGAFEPEVEGGGYLFHFNLTGNRQKIAVNDLRLEDRVADNLCIADKTESESLLFGQDFGIGAQIQTGPNGNLFVLSASHGAIYEISRRH